MFICDLRKILLIVPYNQINCILSLYFKKCKSFFTKKLRSTHIFISIGNRLSYKLWDTNGCRPKFMYTAIFQLLKNLQSVKDF